MTAKDCTLTQEYLKSILSYDKETGLLTRLKKTAACVNIGDIAGYECSTGYRRICIKGKKYLEHRIIWLSVYGKWPDQIDHINHIKTDNRIYNLRSVTETGNSRNLKKYKNNTSKCTGVYWHINHQKWQSRIGVNGKNIYLGLFNDYFEACCTRKSADNKYNFHQNHGV